MNSKDENVDAYIMHDIPCTCSRVVQNIIVFENDLTALSLQEVQDIIMQFSTLLSGSEHYCRCTTEARCSKKGKSKPKRLWFSITSGSRSRISLQRLLIRLASSLGVGASIMVARPRQSRVATMKMRPRCWTSAVVSRSNCNRCRSL